MHVPPAYFAHLCFHESKDLAYFVRYHIPSSQDECLAHSKCSVYVCLEGAISNHSSEGLGVPLFRGERGGDPAFPWPSFGRGEGSGIMEIHGGPQPSHNFPLPEI